MVIKKGSGPPSTQNRRQRKKAEARKRLYKAALHLFLERGYEGTTVQEIADLADVAKATFFNYFPTKEHILAAYHDEMTSEILQELQKLKTRRTEWLILSAMEIFARWAERNKSMGRVILRTVFGSDVLMRADEKNEERLSEWFHSQIETGIASGELKRDLDPDLMCSLILGTLSASVQEWVMSDQSFGLKESLIEKVRYLFQPARSEVRTHRAILNRRKA